MSTPRIVVRGQALKELLNDPNGGVARELKRRGLKVQTAARRSLHQAGTGRTYGSHTASAPGQPPATDTGRLAASIMEELAVDGRGLVERIGTDVDYAVPLELGSRNMEARPFLRPALREGLK